MEANPINLIVYTPNQIGLLKYFKHIKIVITSFQYMKRHISRGISSPRPEMMMRSSCSWT
jgi:hypothetical protein